MRHSIFARLAVVAFAAGLAALLGSAPARADRPIILIPGLQGSVLVQKDHPSVEAWGNYFETKQHFGELQWPLGQTEDPRFAASKILRFFHIFFILNESGYNPIQTFLAQNYGERGRYYEFPYDWRYSNLVTACKLKTWIDNNPTVRAQALSEGVILVAHSMGGLVANLFAHFRAPEGTAPSATNLCPHQYKVAMIISVATPYLGSQNVFQWFAEGPNGVLKKLGIPDDVMLRVVYSIPSFYELTPSYEDCCRVRQSASNPNQWTAFDPLSIRTWERIGWLGNIEKSLPNGRAAVEQYLANARTIRSILMTPLKDVSSVRIGGMGQPKTLVAFNVDAPLPESAPSVPLPYHFDLADKDRDGDDTVPIASATPPMDDTIALTVAVSKTSIADHLGLLNNYHVHDLIRLAIAHVGQPMSSWKAQVKGVAGAPTTVVLLRDGNTREAQQMEIQQESDVLAPNAYHEISFTASGEDPNDTSSITRIGNIDPAAIQVKIETETGATISSKVTALSDDTYSVLFKTPVQPGALQLTITLPGGGMTRSVGFVVGEPG